MKMFKSVVCTFVLLAIFSGNVSAADMSDKSIMALILKVVPHAASCAKEYKLSKKDIYAFTQTQFPEGEHNKCFVNCMFTSLDLMKNGQYTPETAIENSKDLLDNEKDYEQFSAYLRSCDSVNDEEVSDGNKGCDRAFLIHQCLRGHAQLHGFKVNSK